MNTTSEKPKSGRWLRIVGVVLAIVVVLVIAAPTLVSWTIGRSIVAGIVGQSVHGDVHIGAVRFGWTAPQRIERLVIDDRAGSNRVAVDVSIDRSLLSLVSDAMGELDITASGNISTTLTKDGELTLARMIKPSPTPSAPTALPSSLVASVRLEPSTLTIAVEGDDAIELGGLAGTLRFAAADGSLKSDLKGTLRSGPLATISGGRSGTPAASAGAAGVGGAGGATAAGPVKLVTDLTRVVDATGAPTPGAAQGTAALSAGPLALRYGGVAHKLHTFEVSIDARDAKQPIVITYGVTGAAREGVEVAELAGRALVGRDPAGPLGISASQLTASIERGTISVVNGAEPFTARDIKADVALAAGGRASFTIEADTAIGERRGAVTGKGALEHLFNDSFGLTLAEATGSAELTIERAIVPAGPLMMEIDRATATLAAPSTSEPIRAAIDLRGAVRESQASGGATAAAPGSEAAPSGRQAEAASLVANATLPRDAKSSYGISTDPRALTIDVVAKSIPSAILGPFIPAIGELQIVPSRDIGPSVDLALKTTAGAASPTMLSLRAERITADTSVIVDHESGSIRDGKGTIAATLAPELLSKLRVQSPAPLAVSITFDGVTLPRVSEQLHADGASGNLAITVDGPASLALEGRDPIPFSGVKAALRTPRLADGATVGVVGVFDGVPAQVDAQLSGLAGVGKPSFVVETINAKGTLAAGPIVWARPPSVLKESAAKLQSFGLNQTTVGVGFDGGMRSGAAQVKVTDGAQTATTQLAWSAERVRVDATTVTASLTNALLDGLGIADVRLAQPAPVTATIANFELQRADLEAGRVTLPEMSIAVTSPGVSVAKAPGIEKPIALSNIDATVNARGSDDFSARVKGSAVITEVPATQAGSMGTVTFGFEGSRLAVPARTWTASASSKDLAASRVLAIAGVDPARVPGIAAGDRGSLSLTAGSAPGGGLTAEFDSTVGATRGSGKALLASDGSIALPSADLSITLDAARSTAFFSEEKDPHGRPLISRASALPVTLSLRDVSIPAPAADGTRALARAKANATLTTGNLDLEVTGLGAVRLGAVDGRVNLAGNGTLLELRATSTLTTPQTGTHPLALQATLRDFVDPRGDFDWVRMALSGQARMQGLPMALVDVFADGDGVFTDALGPQLEAQVNAVSPPSTGGTVISGNLKSEFMVASLGDITIDDGMVTLESHAPLTAALIPNDTMRQRVLRPINPVLADIRPQQGHPLVFTIDSLSIPTTFSLRDLNTHFVLTVGDVDLERSGAILNLMSLVREDADGIIPGNISPLDVTVRDGLLTYDNFTISMGRIGNTWNQQIFCSGDVDIGSTPMYATAISVDYPIVGIGRLAAGATRFDAVFGRINQVISNLPLVDSNTLRLRATFHGPIEPGRDLVMAFEPVLVTPPGSNPVQAVLDGIFGDKGILRIPNAGGNSAGGSGGGGGSSSGGGTNGSSGSNGSSGPPANAPRDPVRDLFNDIFKKKK